MPVAHREVWEFEGRQAQIEVRNKSGSKKITVRVSHKGVIVSKPRWVARRDALDFLKKSERWVVRELVRLESLKSSIAPGCVMYLGREHEVRQGARRGVRFSDGVFWSGADTESDREKDALKWLRDSAKTVLRERVTERAREIGVRPSKFGVRDQTSRWGSCSSTGSVTFNWRLIMAPPEVLDYIVVHELAHLLELNHSKRFWTIVARHFERYVECEEWLNEHGERLLLIGRKQAGKEQPQRTLF